MYSSKVPFRMMLKMLTLACSEASRWMRPMRCSTIIGFQGRS